MVPFAILVEHLVESLKQQALSIVPEPHGYLMPNGLEPTAYCGIVLGVCIEPSVCSCVMVYVDNAVHPLVDDIVYDFSDTLHPFPVYAVIVIKVWIPCDGDSYDIETA